MLASNVRTHIAWIRFTSRLEHSKVEADGRSESILRQVTSSGFSSRFKPEIWI